MIVLNMNKIQLIAENAKTAFKLLQACELTVPGLT